MINAIGVIPARFASTRFPGKVLADLCGKPLLQHVYEKAKEAKVLEDVIIATDKEEIVKIAKGFGANVQYTSPDQPSGSDRVAEVVNPIDVKVVVNIQADEPLINAEMIDKLALALLEDEKIYAATLIKRIQGIEQILDPNTVKVVIDKDDFALYFSRSAIPYMREQSSGVIYFKHIGIYAFTKDFLFTYKNLPKTILETTEQLEQLRILENGFKIKTIETEHDTVGVDTPQDLEKVKQILIEKESKG